MNFEEKEKFNTNREEKQMSLTDILDAVDPTGKLYDTLIMRGYSNEKVKQELLEMLEAA